MAFTSCKNDVYDVNLSPSYATAPVTVHAIHYDTNRGLDSVTVEIIGRGMAATTDANGCATFELSAGSYKLKMSRPGYLPVSRQFEVTLANEQSDLPIMNTTLTDQRLYPLTGALTGRVTLTEQDETRYQANASVRVHFTLSEGESDAVYLTTTDADGLYAVDSLPEGLELRCVATYLDGNLVYEGEQNIAALKSGQTASAQTVVMTRSAASYGYDILSLPQKPQEPLTIVFPVAADVERIEAGNIVVSNTQTNNRVGIEISWTDGNRTLVINSADPDGWRTGDVNDYTFTVGVPNVEGGMLTASGKFGIDINEGVPGVVQSKFSSDTRTITWNAVTHATSYAIYVKSPSDNDYVLFDTVAAADGAIEEIYSVNSLLVNGLGMYYVKIVGQNSRNEGDLSQAMELTIANINPNDVYYNSAAGLLTWTHIEGVAYYRIMEYSSANDSWTQVARVTAPTEGNTLESNLRSILTTGSHTLKVIGVVSTGIEGYITWATEENVTL